MQATRRWKLATPLETLGRQALIMIGCGLVLSQGLLAEDMGTAFTYQGVLRDADGPVSADCDFEFSLYDVDVGGDALDTLYFSGLEGVSVLDGLFVVQLDFGSGLLDGEARWLGIAVDCSASGSPEELLPRQAITPAPYALKTRGVDGHSLDAAEGGPIDALYVDVDGNVGIGTPSPAAALHVAGTAQIEGTLTIPLAGENDAISITQTNTSKLANVKFQHFGADHGFSIGQDYDVLSHAFTIGNSDSPWERYFTIDLDGNVGIGENDPSSALDVNGIVAADAFVGDGSALTGLSTSPWTSSGDDIYYDEGNVGIGITSPTATLHVAEGTSGDGVILPGLRTEQNGDSPNVIGGYSGNSVDPEVYGATISGGGSNIYPNAVTHHNATVGGGVGNSASGLYATISGGLRNVASLTSSTVGGGEDNSAAAQSATVGGGSSNDASGSYATIAGGVNNVASKIGSTVGGGLSSESTDSYATISGGSGNRASNTYSTVGGGQACKSTGSFSTVPGGVLNVAGGSYSFAAGRRAIVRDALSSGDENGDEGTFVWADSTDEDFTSTGPNQFLIHASNGVGINTNDPSTALDVVGTVKAEFFQGDGSLLDNLPLLWVPSGNDISYQAGNVGIGTTSPSASLDVKPPVATGSADVTAIYARPFHGSGADSSSIRAVYGRAESNSWEGTNDLYGLYGEAIASNTAETPDGVTMNMYGVYGSASGNTIGNHTAIGGYFTASGADNNYAAIFDKGNVGIGILSPETTLDVNGAITIRGGSDIVEPFDVTDEGIQPGMLVCIDPANPGKLRMARTPYDRTVAGVVSGAGGVKPGMILFQEGVLEGTHPVALSGRVKALCDASYGAINPGDLLTTSNTPGHAMKVMDHGRSSGAIIGKAMSSLESSRGLVLVLVSLQ